MGFLQQDGVAAHVFTDEQPAAAGRRRGSPAQRAELVVAHDAQRLPGLDHVAHDVQRFADVRATVDDVAKEQRHALRMSPHAVLQAIAEAFEQLLKGFGAAVDIADDVVAARGIELHHSPPPPRRLPQPSLVRQIS